MAGDATLSAVASRPGFPDRGGQAVGAIIALQVCRLSMPTRFLDTGAQCVTGVGEAGRVVLKL